MHFFPLITITDFQSTKTHFNIFKSHLKETKTNFQNTKTHFQKAKTHFHGILIEWIWVVFGQKKSLYLEIVCSLLEFYWRGFIRLFLDTFSEHYLALEFRQVEDFLEKVLELLHNNVKFFSYLCKFQINRAFQVF